MSYYRYTWQEATEHERERLGREPTEKEIERFFNYMNSD